MRYIVDFFRKNEENIKNKGRKEKNSERRCKGLISLKKDRSRPEPLRIFHHGWLLSSITARRVDTQEYVCTRRNFQPPTPAPQQALVEFVGVSLNGIWWFY
jgi:hypothetical protein